VYLSNSARVIQLSVSYDHDLIPLSEFDFPVEGAWRSRDNLAPAGLALGRRASQAGHVATSVFADHTCEKSPNLLGVMQDVECRVWRVVTDRLRENRKAFAAILQ
jgi:hypothetical protein